MLLSIATPEEAVEYLWAIRNSIEPGQREHLGAPSFVDDKSWWVDLIHCLPDAEYEFVWAYSTARSNEIFQYIKAISGREDAEQIQ